MSLSVLGAAVHARLWRVMTVIAAVVVAAAAAPALASASAPNATVGITQYSPHVSGNIGEDVSGVGVTVELLRNGVFSSGGTASVPTYSEVAEATTSTTADGNWGVELASVNPTSGLPDGFLPGDDEISVSYTSPLGSGTPVPGSEVYNVDADTVHPYGQAPDLTYGAYVSADGTQLTTGGGRYSTYCGNADFDVDGAFYPISNIGYTGPNGPNYCDETIASPASPVTNNDTVSFVTPQQQPDGSSYYYYAPLGLVGESGGPPTCTADLTTDQVTCSHLSAGGFALLLDGGTPVPLSVAPIPYSNEFAGSATVPRLVGGDTLALEETSPVATMRPLTTLHVAHLKVVETLSGAGSIDCDPNKLLGTLGFLTAPCPANGVLADNTAVDGTAYFSSFDDLSGGSTTITPATLASTLPQANDELEGAYFQAYAFLPNYGSETFSQYRSITLSVIPRGGTKPVFTGTGTPHNDSVGPYEAVDVTGLAPGLYNAIWQVTDRAGDTITDQPTQFVAQPGGQLPVSVTCTLGGPSNSEINCTVTVNAQNSSAVSVELVRGDHTYATKRATARDGLARFTLASRRALARGTYTVKVAARHGRVTGVKTFKLKLR